MTLQNLVCANEAGRDVKQIFRLVNYQVGYTKLFARLWISSMEGSTIKEGFASLKPSTEYDACFMKQPFAGSVPTGSSE